ncbi:hypothetical protein D3C72_2496310 [compost metagenome]
MGAEGPLLDLGLAVMFWTCLAYRLLEQRDQLGDVLLPQRHDLQGGRLPCWVAHLAGAHRAGACGRLALGRPATTRS